MTLIAYVFFVVRTPKNVVRQMSTKSPSTSTMVDGPKHWSKLNNSTFAMFIDPCESNSE